MAELILERDKRLELRGAAHHLKPVVLLGARGLTDAVEKEVERALDEHGLIKIHVPSDDREERDEIYTTLADKLNAARIQAIGKMLVLWREPKEKKSSKHPVRNAADEEAAAKLRKKTAIKKPSMKKQAKPAVIKARPKHKHITKKAALSKC